MAFDITINAGNPLYRKIARYRPEMINIGIANMTDVKTVTPGVHNRLPEIGINSPNLR